MKDQEKLDIEKNTNKDESQDNRDINNDDLQEEVEELDPTHFGDWQIGCKTIDF